MPNSIKVDGGFTIDTLREYAAKNGGNIKGQMKQGMLEVYSSKHGAGLFPTRSMRKQGLANAALHTALTNSFGAKVADAVFSNMEAQLYRDGGYLTHDLILMAEQKAINIAAQQRPGAGGRGRAVSSTSGVSDVSNLFDEAPTIADGPAKAPVPTEPRPVPPFERPDPPTTGIKRTLDNVTGASNSSRADRLRRLEDKAAQDRSRVNQMAGRRFLERHGFGALLMAARDPDRKDRLGAAHGFAKESTRPGFQGPSQAKAEEAILQAFEQYDKGSIAAMSDSEKWDLAVDALEDYLALHPDADG